MTVRELAKRMRSLNLDTLKQQAANDSRPVIIKAQRKQMRKGENALGAAIGRYSPSYLAYKRTLNTYKAPSGVPDLFLTGAFQGSIKLDIKGTALELSSSDSKTGKLTGMYGPEIFGLSATSLASVHGPCTRALGKRLKSQLKLS